MPVKQGRPKSAVVSLHWQRSWVPHPTGTGIQQAVHLPNSLELPEVQAKEKLDLLLL